MDSCGLDFALSGASSNVVRYTGMVTTASTENRGVAV
jgi:hypothetical protein